MSLSDIAAFILIAVSTMIYFENRSRKKAIERNNKKLAEGIIKNVENNAHVATSDLSTDEIVSGIESRYKQGSGKGR